MLRLKPKSRLGRCFLLLIIWGFVFLVIGNLLLFVDFKRILKSYVCDCPPPTEQTEPPSTTESSTISTLTTTEETTATTSSTTSTVPCTISCPPIPEPPPLPIVKFYGRRQGYNITYPTKERPIGDRKCTRSRALVINYGSHHEYWVKQESSCIAAVRTGGADACISYQPEFLDDKFKQQNDWLLRHGHGAGLWLWKPYVIFQTLLAMNPGDYLFYLDSDWNLVSSMDPYICFMRQLSQDIVAFYQSFPEWEWTKADAYFLMNMENVPNVPETAQPRGGFMFLRRTPHTMRFVGEWLTYAQDPRILTSERSKFREEVPGFRDNRHDQTVYSLLTKKWNVTVFPDPMLPWRRDFIEAHIGPNRSVLLKAYNPVDVDLPNHPVLKLIHNCVPSCAPPPES